MDAWDPTAVIATAKELIHSSNYEKVSDARATVDATLASWVQTVTTLPPSAIDARARGTARVVALWRAYAALEIELRQFKQATKVFDAATACPLAKTQADVWIAYATFCIDRKKLSNARKVYLRALALPNLSASAMEQLWHAFHAFVVAHFDPHATRAQLEHQMLRPPVVNTAPAPVVNTAPLIALPPMAVTPVMTPSASASAVDIDPSLAFVDTTGNVEALPLSTPTKRLHDEPAATNRNKRFKPSVSAAAPARTAFATSIPLTLPFLPTCPHLLFDALAVEHQHVALDALTLDRLADLLQRHSVTVFQTVRLLRDEQRTRDRATLYRWQDLVGMQMKEGAELYQRHVSEAKTGSFGSDAVQKSQREEFVTRCQLSQMQFVDITAIDRLKALAKQQTTLRGVNVPTASVTTDPAVIAKQRAIVALIVETDKWRREDAAAKGTSTVATVASSPARAGAAAPRMRPAAAKLPVKHVVAPRNVVISSPIRSTPSRNMSGSYSKPQQQQQKDLKHAPYNRSGGNSSSFRGGRSSGGYSSSAAAAGRGGGGGGYHGSGGGGGGRGSGSRDRSAERSSFASSRSASTHSRSSAAAPTGHSDYDGRRPLRASNFQPTPRGSSGSSGSGTNYRDRSRDRSSDRASASCEYNSPRYASSQRSAGGSGSGWTAAPPQHAIGRYAQTHPQQAMRSSSSGRGTSQMLLPPQSRTSRVVAAPYSGGSSSYATYEDDMTYDDTYEDLQYAAAPPMRMVLQPQPQMQPQMQMQQMQRRNTSSAYHQAAAPAARMMQYATAYDEQYDDSYDDNASASSSQYALPHHQQQQQRGGGSSYNPQQQHALPYQPSPSVPFQPPAGRSGPARVVHSTGGRGGGRGFRSAGGGGYQQQQPMYMEQQSHAPSGYSNGSGRGGGSGYRRDGGGGGRFGRR